MENNNNYKRLDWWAENDALKKKLDIPEYEPPRFKDGVYTYIVENKIRQFFGIKLQFVGIDTEYPDDWEVRVDGRSLFTIPHHRDSNGNTIYQITADEFVDRLSKHKEIGPRNKED